MIQNASLAFTSNFLVERPLACVPLAIYGVHVSPLSPFLWLYGYQKYDKGSYEAGLDLMVM